MSEHITAMKFLLWGSVVALGLTGTVSLTKATYRMAEAAVFAQSKNQLSYGKYSRMLWQKSSSKPKKQSR